MVQAEGFCISERSLRQGCPLSPYLFILCSQELSWLMRTMENSAPYNGYKICKKSIVVSHLMFADDLLLFGTLEKRIVQALMEIFNIYDAWSGQCANMVKFPGW